ncbi:MAG: hypothetical protein R3293_13170 [Candidatus Promineifilaceae bacterium]|nr:hypothetical protein [Candidatus Promineifilaceae bacterium]
MSGLNENQDNANTEGDYPPRKIDNLDTQANILQGTFSHYYNVALDHHSKATSNTNILLAVLAAILVLVGLDNEVCPDAIDIGSTIGIMVIGLFGFVWTLKQHERYQYWKFIALEYQKEIIDLMPGNLKSPDDYKDLAQRKAEKIFFHSLGSIISEEGFLKDRRLWAILHLGIMLFGYLALIAATSGKFCPAAAA